MTIATIPGTETPLSGWHWVFPCGWAAHDHSAPPEAKVAQHRADHRAQIEAMRAPAGVGSVT